MLRALSSLGYSSKALRLPTHQEIPKLQYHYLRLSLSVPPLLELKGAMLSMPSRQEYLVEVFSNRIEFQYLKKRSVYVPIGQVGLVMLGRVGRSVLSPTTSPPEADFVETSDPHWRAANVLINTGGHPDGQKIAFQPKVGKPLSITTELIKQVNEARHDAWFIEVNPVTDETSFWDAVSQHPEEITEARFTFSTPNVLGMDSDLNDELKRKRDKHRASSVTETLYNPEGGLIIPKDKQVEDVMAYISKGGGKARLKAGPKVLFNSVKQTKYAVVEGDEPLTKEERSAWLKLINKLFPR